MKTKLVFLHLYPGVLMLAFYVLVAPLVMSYGFPGMMALLGAELLILVPLCWRYLKVAGGRGEIQEPVFSFASKILLGFLACIILYAPMFAVGLWARTHLFFWLPEWFYDPGFDWASRNALIITFSLGILIDGIVGPLMEEFYFRGYLLSQMKGSFAPLINAALFTVYHFWQPHNYAAIFMVSLVLSYATWWTKNVWVSVGIHCLVNIVGSATGLMAAIGGIKPY